MSIFPTYFKIHVVFVSETEDKNGVFMNASPRFHERQKHKE